MRKGWTRRTFLLRALPAAAGGWLSACRVLSPPPPTPTPAPPTPTPRPSPAGTATAALEALTREAIDELWALLTPASQAAMPREDLQARWRETLNAAGVQAIEIQPLSLIEEGESARARYRIRWKTALFGEREAEGTLELRWTAGGWRVVWRDALLWPELREGERLQVEYVIPERANLYDREGRGLAVQGEWVEIGVVPGQIADEGQLLARLTQATGLPPATIRARYAGGRPDWYMPVLALPADRVAPFLTDLEATPGVVLRSRSGRIYAGVAAQTVGIVGKIPAEELDAWRRRGYRGDEWVGRMGLEAWGEPYLAGTHGGRLWIQPPRPEDGPSRLLAERPFTPGRPITTTLDRELQARVEEIFGDRTGAVVVMDPRNGDILAMVSRPAFDPNALFGPNPPPPPPGAFLNRATQGLYPPGSIFKIVVMAAALTHGFTARSAFQDPGYWDGLGPGYRKWCWLRTGHGMVDLPTALTVSCNVAFYQLGFALHQQDPDLLPRMARAFGLGAPTGIRGVPEEAGLVPDAAWRAQQGGRPWSVGDAVNMSIGQSDLLVTPLQIARMLAAVANGGILYRPRLVQRIGPAPGVPEETFPPEIQGRLPVPEEALAVIREGLVGVTTHPRGTATWVFRGMPFAVAGKTGTAETAPGRPPHAWFACYAPADRPERVVVVIVENGGQGSAVAAPIARQILEAAYSLPLTPLPTPPPQEDQ
jgi:penicillin-binding protein 2